MKIFKVTILFVALALLCGTFSVDAKVKKRRSTTKKEKTIKSKKTRKSVEAKVEKCGLDMVEYDYQGMRMTPVAHMRVERRGNDVVMVIKGTVTEEKEYVIDDGEQLLKDALEIIEQEKMLDYGASYEPEIQPLDGYFWSFGARLADGRSVSSQGHNAEPGGDGLDRINRLLMERAQKLLGME